MRTTQDLTRLPGSERSGGFGNVARDIGLSMGVDQGRKLIMTDEKARRGRRSGQGVGRQDDGGRGVGRLLAAGEVDLVGKNDPGPVAVFLGSEPLGPGEERARGVVLAD